MDRWNEFFDNGLFLFGSAWRSHSPGIFNFTGFNDHCQRIIYQI